MFKATDFKLIRRLCLDDLNELLRLLKIPAPNFSDGDEFEIYGKLDRAIDEKFCAMLNCKSDLDGYAKLLDLGGIKFDSGETRNSMLKKVLANREKILQATSAQAGDKNSASSNSGVSVPSIVGGILIAGGIAYAALTDEPNHLITGAGVVLGVIGIIAGLSGGKKSDSSPPQKNLSRAQVETALPILERVNKIFDSI